MRRRRQRQNDLNLVVGMNFRNEFYYPLTQAEASDETNDQVECITQPAEKSQNRIVTENSETWPPLLLKVECLSNNNGQIWCFWNFDTQISIVANEDKIITPNVKNGVGVIRFLYICNLC
ncbi:hypothetical protein H5410_014171 [Solanum commersonii]|uniref:Uncharacterized protein n=1 Tax=Solanum commersonii TaxID=4109 RepID=A0A9J5ZQG9_SOLCO|nr:hypothetical protein H5410_014171 [Solanum commersonii]